MENAEGCFCEVGGRFDLGAKTLAPVFLSFFRSLCLSVCLESSGVEFLCASGRQGYTSTVGNGPPPHARQ